MTRASSRPLLGISYFLGAMLLFPFLDTIAKYLCHQDLPPMEIVWSRLLFGAVSTGLFLAATEGTPKLRPTNVKINAVRGAVIVVSTLCFFWAMKFQGIAETLSIFFIYPIITTALAPLVLGEHVGMRRWAAVAVGLVGMLIIVRPGFRELNPGMVLGALSGILTGVAMILTRMMSSKASAVANTFYISLFGMAFASLAVLTIWQTPTSQQVGWLLLLGLIGTTANYLTILAARHAEASLLAPIGYTEMINATFCGWYFFGDFPDNLTFVGVAVLIACTTYISYRERNRSAESIADPGQV